MGALVNQRISGSLMASIALQCRLEIGLQVPVVVMQQSDPISGLMTSGLPSSGFGDLHISPKFGLVQDHERGFYVALTSALTVNTATADGYFGEIHENPNVAINSL